MNRFLLALAGLLLITFGAIAQTTNGLTKAEIEGRQLTDRILQQRPTDDLTNTGVLQIRRAKSDPLEIPVRFEIVVKELNSLNWLNIYQTEITNEETSLTIVHSPGSGPNGYFLEKESKEKSKVDDIMVPFADSDFWIADLGLEFFHWPDQKILKHEERRTRACAVLQSANPNPVPGSYSRVVTWIDNESLAIIWAEAYDANGKLLKEFDPKKVKKINGQWQLEDMEIRNVQTKSRTSIKFDLKSK